VRRVTTNTPPSRRTQAERTAETRGKLLDAAVDCLVEAGYSRTSTQEIARRAGVSRGAQLHHFPTKESLVVAAVERIVEMRLAEILASGPGGLDKLFETFSGRLYYAALELWVAARTDESLRVAMAPLEQTVATALQVGGQELYGDEMSAEAIELSIELARGFGVSAIFRSPESDRDFRRRLMPIWEKMVTDK
jgi:AcrR family transcriptional regulator